jgi:mannose-6-phosphate isomerase-like protein (cupin superfamily)
VIIRNYLTAEHKLETSHDGKGQVNSVKLFDHTDFSTPLRFLYHIEMDPGTSIGYHQHGENEELYVVLEGSGTMTVNGEAREVEEGDIIVNKPGWSHGLQNTSETTIELLVFEVEKPG